ncbi:MAG: hypothetical protein OEQ53_22840, partial [Saprospiraceae bacterium]|nr:hypothetical protein [Saprospiraceae bacterium]
DTIDIRNTQVGFTVVEGSVINEGSILTLNSELQAIKVTAGAHLTNTGEMSTAESGKGLDVSEDGFIFHQSGMICLSGKDIGLHISDGGTIDIASPADLFVRSNVGEPLVIELGGEFNCLGTLTAEHFIN